MFSFTMHTYTLAFTVNLHILYSHLHLLSVCTPITVLRGYLRARVCFPPSLVLNIAFRTICENDFVPIISPSALSAGQQRLLPPPALMTPPPQFSIHTLNCSLSFSVPWHQHCFHPQPEPPEGGIWGSQDLGPATRGVRGTEGDQDHENWAWVTSSLFKHFWSVSLFRITIISGESQWSALFY